MLSARQITWLNRMDWVLAIASLGYGLYQRSWLWIGFGLISFPLAWWNPTERFHRYVQGQFTHKTRIRAQRRSTNVDANSDIKPFEPSHSQPTSSRRPHYLWKVPPLDYKPWIRK